MKAFTPLAPLEIIKAKKEYRESKSLTGLEITKAKRKQEENKSLTPLEVFRSGRNYKKNTPLTGLTGFTLIETIITIAIFILAMGAVTGFIVTTYRIYGYTWQQVNAIAEARRGVETMVKEIREAMPGDDGSFIIERADDFEFIFFSNIDGDESIERVRYFVQGTYFKKGAINPTGWPIQYTLADEDIIILSRYVRNLPPIFRYFDGQGIELAAPARLRDTKVMRVRLIINVNPYRLPDDFYLESDVQIRNLKVNL